MVEYEQTKGEEWLEKFFEHFVPYLLIGLLVLLGVALVVLLGGLAFWGFGLIFSGGEADCVVVDGLEYCR